MARPLVSLWRVPVLLPAEKRRTRVLSRSQMVVDISPTGDPSAARPASERLRTAATAAWSPPSGSWSARSSGYRRGKNRGGAPRSRSRPGKHQKTGEQAEQAAVHDCLTTNAQVEDLDPSMLDRLRWQSCPYRSAGHRGPGAAPPPPRARRHRGQGHCRPDHVGHCGSAELMVQPVARERRGLQIGATQGRAAQRVKDPRIAPDLTHDSVLNVIE